MKKNISLVNSNREIAERELKAGFITYFTLAERINEMVLCNNMSQRCYNTMHLINGIDYDEETEKPVDIFQWYIITRNGAEYLIQYTDELVFYDDELNLYVWGITHCGTSWKYVYTDIKATENMEDLF